MKNILKKNPYGYRKHLQPKHSLKKIIFLKIEVILTRFQLKPFTSYFQGWTIHFILSSESKESI